MVNQLIFIPVLLQMLIVIVLFLRLANVKETAIANGEVDHQRRALYPDAWPNAVIQVNNAINNQFQAPLLFYILVLVLWQLDGINTLTHLLAWIFTISRLVHAYIHVTTNRVPKRRLTFTIGIAVLAALMIQGLWFCIAPVFF